MKRNFFIVFLFVILYSTVGNTQVIQSTKLFRSDFGVKLGVNYQSIVGTPWKSEYNSDFILGVYRDMMRNTSGWRFELNCTEGRFTTIHPAAYFPEGHRITQPNWDTTHVGDFYVVYLRLPILAEFKLYKGVYFLIGPEYSQQLSITDNNNAFSTDYANKGGLSSIFRKGELLGDIGLEGKFKQHMIFGARFCLGLTNVNKGKASTTENNFRSLDNWKLWSLQFTFAFKLKSNF